MTSASVLIEPLRWLASSRASAVPVIARLRERLPDFLGCWPVRVAKELGDHLGRFLAAGRGDALEPLGVFAFDAEHDPEIEWVMAGRPAPGRSTGVAGMAVSFGDFLDAWDPYRMVATEQ